MQMAFRIDQYVVILKKSGRSRFHDPQIDSEKRGNIGRIIQADSDSAENKILDGRKGLGLQSEDDRHNSINW
jgi:hypothetical protein